MADNIASGGPATVNVVVEIDSPIETAFKWGAALVLWMELFNVSVVLIRYKFDMTEVLHHWPELVFFPLTLLYRWGQYGSRGALLPSDGECNVFQRALLGGTYCDTTAKYVSAVKDRFSGTPQEQRDKAVAIARACE